MQCCGIHSYQDWRPIFNNDSLPYTCCKDERNDGSCTVKSENKFEAGCLPNLKDYLENAAYIIGGVGIGIAVVQVRNLNYFISLTDFVPGELLK